MIRKGIIFEMIEIREEVVFRHDPDAGGGGLEWQWWLFYGDGCSRQLKNEVVVGSAFVCVNETGRMVFFYMRKKSVAEPAPPAHEPRDVETIERLQQRIQELEFQQLQQVSSAEDTETECNVWDDGSEDVNPFGGGNHLLTKETESKPIIWDIGDEEEEYPFVNKYPSFKEEPIMFVKDESCHVNDTDNEEEDGDKDDLLKHSSMDVRASVASCIGEITRITAPYAPYGDDEMKEQPNHEMDVLAGHENDVNYVQFSGCDVASKISSSNAAKEENLSKFKNTWFTHDNIVTCSRDVPPPPMPPQQPREGPCQRILPTPRGVNMIVWSLDNRFILAAIMDSRICVWNAVDGSLVHSLTGVPIRIFEIGCFKQVDGKFSPDGTSIVLSDEFFLGDYMPLIQDVHGNVLDQETQLAPYRRNMQDLLCDSRMIPPSSVRFAVGTNIYLIDEEYQVPPIADLDILMDPLPKFLDAMDWEPGIEISVPTKTTPKGGWCLNFPIRIQVNRSWLAHHLRRPPHDIDESSKNFSSINGNGEFVERKEISGSPIKYMNHVSLLEGSIKWGGAKSRLIKWLRITKPIMSVAKSLDESCLDGSYNIENVVDEKQPIEKGEFSHSDGKIKKGKMVQQNEKQEKNQDKELPIPLKKKY
nr:hypothetical protein [Tanacetum cinerariifolium]